MVQYSTPKNVFLHLMMMAMLYLSVISLIVLLNSYINYIYPDVLNYYVDYYYPIRLTSSILLISFPVFILMNFIVGREMEKISEVKDSAIRKWLIYFTLFVSAITIIIYLIRLVFNFYSGDLTFVFFLKVLIVLVVTGFVFVYYFMELYEKIKNHKPFLYTVLVVMLSSLIAGFFIVGSPAHQRLARFDVDRINDLNEIQFQVVNYWQYKGRLPNSLEDLKNDINFYAPNKDPETNTNYIYNVKNDLSFELCAVFSTENLNPGSINSPKTGLENEANWAHGIGKECFVRTIDPDFYKKIDY